MRDIFPILGLHCLICVLCVFCACFLLSFLFVGLYVGDVFSTFFTLHCWICVLCALCTCFLCFILLMWVGVVREILPIFLVSLFDMCVVHFLCLFSSLSSLDEGV